MIKKVLEKLVKCENLQPFEVEEIMDEILNNKITSAQTAAFLTALRTKGETIDEITSCIKVLKKYGLKLSPNFNDVIDIVGTGGDGANTFNISTAAAFVVSSGGLTVAKHGNRAFSSKSGAADILEAIGANINLNVEQNETILKKTGFCFMYASNFSPLMKNVAQVRKELKIRTVFNCLGPLINPSGAKTQLIGVYSKELVEPVAHVMKNLGVKRGIALFGEGGLDEASITSKTFYAKLKNDKVETGTFEPEDFGLKRADIKDIQGGTPKENAEIMKGIFKNEIKNSKRDVVVLNSALAFYIANKVKTIKEGIELSNNLLDSGEVYKKTVQFIESTNEYIR